MKKLILYFLLLLMLLSGGYYLFTRVDPPDFLKGEPYVHYQVGQVVDALNGVQVYYNGPVANVEGRHLSKDGYNIGQKYQCVEFVKRYYYEYYQHKMPDSWGHAKDFFDPGLGQGAFNKKRALWQFKNHAKEKPQVGDLVVFGKSFFNPYGHVAIVSKVGEDSLEIIQQNPGPLSPSRETYALEKKKGLYSVKEKRLLGWLRLKSSQ